MKADGLLFLVAAFLMVLPAVQPDAAESVPGFEGDLELFDRQIRLSPEFYLSSSSVQFSGLSDSLAIGVVGYYDRHFISFMMVDSVVELGGAIIVTFPRDFDLSEIGSFDYADDDSLNVDPQFSSFEVAGGSLKLDLDTVGALPADSFWITISVDSVLSTSHAGSHVVIVTSVDSLGALTGGPTASPAFVLEPDELASIDLNPEGEQTIEAGKAILFSCFGWDQFGNERTDFVPYWVIVAAGEPATPVGQISDDGVFSARFVGTSRVACLVGVLADTSSLIHVIPTSFDRYEVTGFPDFISAGAALSDSVAVYARDVFGNVLTEFNKSVWFVTTDGSASIAPNSSSPYAFVAGVPAQARFPGSNFVFRTAGLQSIYLTDGVKKSRESGIVVSAGTVYGFDLSVPVDVRAGEPFELGVSNVRDAQGNLLDAFVTVALSEPGESPAGYSPRLSSFPALGGSGSHEQVLVLSGRAQLLVTVGGKQAASDSITVSNGAAESFELRIASPQFLGRPFSGPSHIRVFDRFGNAAVDFDASADPVTIEASDGGSILPSLIDSDSAFVDGFCDLALLGLQYEGGERYLTFGAVSDSGVKGTSNIVEIHAVNLERLVVSPQQVDTGDTLAAVVSIVNYGSEVAGVDELLLRSSQGDMVVISYAVVPPCTIAGGSTLVDTLRTVIPDSFSAGWTRFKASYRGMYAGLSISGESGYLDSARVVRRPLLTYDSTSLQPTMVSIGQSYAFRCGIIYTGVDNVVLDTSSSIRLMSAGGDTLDFRLENPAYIPALNEPIMLYFREGVVSSAHGSGLFSVRLDLSGLQGYSPYSDTIIPGDSVLVQTPALLVFETGSLSPVEAFRGTEITPSFTITNEGEASISLIADQTVLSLASGLDEIRFSLPDSDITLHPGSNSLWFGSKTVPAWFSLGTGSVLVDIHGIENGHSRTISLHPADDKIVFKQQALIRLESLFVEDAPNAPKVNVGQSFTIAVVLSNDCDEGLDSISMVLHSNGFSVYDEQLWIESMAVGEIDTIRAHVEASDAANPAELFWVDVTSVTGSETGLGGTVIIPSPLHSTVAVSIQTPAEIAVSARIDSPSSAVGGVVDAGQEFHISASFANRGQAAAGIGSVKLSFGDTGFRTDDDSLVEFVIGDIVGWNVVAPADIGAYEIAVVLSEIPVDSNSGSTAAVAIGLVSIPVLVQRQGLVLEVEHEFYDKELAGPGERYDVVDLTFVVSAGNPEAEVRLDRVSFGLEDRGGWPLVAGEVLADAEISHSGHTYEGQMSHGRVDFLFGEDVVLSPKTVQSMTLAFTIRSGFSLSSFFVTFDSSGVVATDVTYGIEGSRVAVVGKNGAPLSVIKGYGMVADDFKTSLVNYPNPFAAGFEETNIAYFLEEPADVTLEIFTLIGEAVFSLEIESGLQGAIGGERNVLVWDGRNSRGDIVRNGVYIAVLKLSTGAEARRKIAVVK